MTDTNRLASRVQDAAILTGLQQFSNLPDWLAAIRDHERTHGLLSRDIPEIADGSLLLKKSKIGHVSYKDGAWHNRCTLKVQAPGDPAKKTIDLMGIFYPPGSISVDRPLVEGRFGSEGWRAILPELNLELSALEPETELAAFDLLSDPEKAREFLERSLRDASPGYGTLEIQSCTAEIVRYKPGDRCTVLYRLEYVPETSTDVHAPAILVAKTTKGEKGRNAFAGLSALWSSSFRSQGVVHIAEPIAYDADLNVFVQGPVLEEQTLAESFLSALEEGTPEALEAINDMMRKTARGLAGIHQSGVRTGQAVSWADEMAEIEANLFPMCAVFPEMYANAQPFLSRLRQLEAATSLEPFVPSHGTFRPVQVLLHRGELSFIDFDSFCQSEPARDLSMFVTSLMSIGLAPPAADKGKGPHPTLADLAAWEDRFQQVFALREQFLAAYEQHHPVSRQRIALWEALNLFYFVVAGWTKAKTSEVPLLVRLLERFLSASQLIQPTNSPGR